MEETNNILAILDNYIHNNPDEIAHDMANDFRKRRIEKNLTREQVAEESGVAVSNIIRFEQKGLISLKNLISIAMTLGYTHEIKNIFSEPKEISDNGRTATNKTKPEQKESIQEWKRLTTLSDFIAVGTKNKMTCER